MTIYAAVCEFKLKHLGRREIERLPDTTDDTAALKLYMLAELSRVDRVVELAVAGAAAVGAGAR